MAKQTLVIESPMGLSLSDGMLAISDRGQRCDGCVSRGQGSVAGGVL